MNHPNRNQAGEAEAQAQAQAGAQAHAAAQALARARAHPRYRAVKAARDFILHHLDNEQTLRHCYRKLEPFYSPEHALAIHRKLEAAANLIISRTGFYNIRDMRKSEIEAADLLETVVAELLRRPGGA